MRSDLTLYRATASSLFASSPHRPGALLRRYDTTPYLTTIAEEINNSPRRRLGLLTPTESLARLLAGES